MSGWRTGGRRIATVSLVLPLLLAATSWFAGPAGAATDDHALNDEYVAVVPGTTLGLVPLHPTALGEANFARILAAHLTGDAEPHGGRDS